MVSFKRLIAALVPVAFVAVYSWFGVYTFVNGFVIRELKGTNADWTTIAMWLVGGIIAWQFIVNELATRIGRRNTITLGLVIAGVAFGGLAICRDLKWVGPLLAFMAFTQASATGVWLPMIADVGRERPGKAMAVLMTVNVTVTVASIILGGYLVKQFSYSTMFIASGVACVASAVFFHAVAGPLERGQKTAAIGIRSLRREDIPQLTRPSVIILFVIMGLEPFNYLTLNSLYPNLARDEHGIGEQTISVIVALGRVPSTLSLLLLGHYIDKLNPNRWYGVSMAIVAGVIVAMGFAETPWLVVVLFPMFYLFHGAVWASNNAAVNAAVEPRLRDVAFTLQSLVTNLTVLVIGGFHTLLIDRKFTIKQVFVISGSVSIGAGVVLFISSYFTKQRSKPEVDAKELAMIENQ